MRTNIVLNDALVAAAQRHAKVKSKSAVVERALRTYVQLKEQEERRERYTDRLANMQKRMARKRFGVSGLEILREDRLR